MAYADVADIPIVWSISSLKNHRNFTLISFFNDPPTLFRDFPAYLGKPSTRGYIADISFFEREIPLSHPIVTS